MPSAPVSTDRGLFVHRSNRLEILLEVLASLVADSPGSPLAPELLVVQSKGMATWLGMRLAERFGVWGDRGFLHPRRFAALVCGAALGDEAAETLDSFSRQRLVMAVLAELPGLLRRPEAEPLRHYLRCGVDEEISRLDLAHRLAAVFDQYGIYRPELMLAWERQEKGGPLGPQDQWQPLLWRAISTRIGSPARLLWQGYQRLLKGGLAVPANLPERAMFFGISSLPPVYLELMAAAARHLPIHLFLLSPTSHYWGTPSPARGRFAGPADDHPLLTANGIIGRDFLNLLEELGDYQEPLADQLYQGHDQPDSALAILQQDLLELRHPGLADSSFSPLILEPADDSIVLHDCHSGLREVEVLQDQILAMLNEEGLAPHDILVMVPDIDGYAPLIEAVFDRPVDDPRFVPYRIADRGLGRQAPLIEDLFSLFALCRSRFHASEVLDFLGREPVRRRYGITAEELERLHQWVVAAGIRWGADADHRRAAGQPADDQNTWRFGSDRLLLGYAMEGEELFAGVLPLEAVAEQETVLAGNLFRFCEDLFSWSRTLARPQSAATWQQSLLALLECFFLVQPEEEWQLQVVREAVASLARDARAVALEERLGLATVETLLRHHFEQAGGEHGFLEGGVTFCAMLPMRSIPFQVICLLGMNDGSFPRDQQSPSFDLLSRFPRPGDRCRRLDDRYLFLEAILAARKRLSISYQGRGPQDNTRRPPSVVVEELLDCLTARLAPPDQEAAGGFAARRRWLRERLTVVHRLQPFHPEYFADRQDRLFSYASDWWWAVRSRRQRKERPPFLAGWEGGKAEGIGPVFLADLKQFFKAPARWFVEQELRLSLTGRELEIPDREPLFLDPLGRYRLADRLLDVSLSSSPATWEEQCAASGELPPGALGRAALAEVYAEVEPLLRARHRYVQGEELPPLAAEISVPGQGKLHGDIRQRWPAGLVRVRFSQQSRFPLLAAWLDHLVLCAVNPSDQVKETWLIGRGDKRESAWVGRLRPVARPLTLLLDLVELFLTGRQQPLLLFPRASLEAARVLLRNPGEHQRAGKAAARAFQGSWDGAPGEGDDPSVRLLFGQQDLLAALFPAGSEEEAGVGFFQLALRLYGPLLSHLEEG